VLFRSAARCPFCKINSWNQTGITSCFHCAPSASCMKPSRRAAFFGIPTLTPSLEPAQAKRNISTASRTA